MSYNEKVTEMFDELRDVWGVSEETLQVVTCINGWNEETMRDILFCQFGENTFEFETEN